MMVILYFTSIALAVVAKHPGYLHKYSPAKPPPMCGYNEELVKCKTICPPQSCEIAYTEYQCGPNKCEPGCDCLPNYLRNSSGICILNDECPPPPTAPSCGENEELSDCKVVCPPQSCESIYTLYLCPKGSCEPGCNCIDGYLRNASGICIPSQQCPLLPSLPECGVNEEATDCKIKCPPQTCESIHTTYMCSNQTCEPGCNCIDGHLRNASDICIPSDKCFINGNSCGVNETYADCGFRCPNQYCPEDDSGAIVLCKPGRPCPPGCLCKPYYKRKSYNDDTCVLASDCPPVNCTKPNEVWDPCSSECLAERCEDLDIKNPCYPDPDNCQPKCVCAKGYFRDTNSVCIPEKECPNKCNIPRQCRPTCSIPNPTNCSYIEPVTTNIDGCQCQTGYILSEEGGKCIKIEECPTNLDCNGDPHAMVKECPLPCPSTCASPNAFPCKRKCDPIGCVCKSGYILSETNRKCILPDQCKGGNPCGPNGTFVECKGGCPTDYCPVDDSRGILICETYPFSPCYSGCICKINYRKRSREDDRCILASECPPVECTRPKEKWSPCPSACLAEYCEDVDNQPTACNTFVLNCQPKCICEKNYFRNASDICISAHKCRQLNKKRQIPNEG